MACYIVAIRLLACLSSEKSTLITAFWIDWNTSGIFEKYTESNMVRDYSGLYSRFTERIIVWYDPLLNSAWC